MYIYVYVCAACGTSGMLYGLICCLFGIPCVYSCTFRAKLRNKFGLLDAPAPDWITHCFCEYCALCQEYRELNNRGLDPAIGKPILNNLTLNISFNHSNRFLLF